MISKISGAEISSQYMKTINFNYLNNRHFFVFMSKDKFAVHEAKECKPRMSKSRFQFVANFLVLNLIVYTQGQHQYKNTIFAIDTDDKT